MIETVETVAKEWGTGVVDIRSGVVELVVNTGVVVELVVNTGVVVELVVNTGVVVELVVSNGVVVELIVITGVVVELVVSNGVVFELVVKKVVVVVGIFAHTSAPAKAYPTPHVKLHSTPHENDPDGATHGEHTVSRPALQPYVSKLPAPQTEQFEGHAVIAEVWPATAPHVPVVQFVQALARRVSLYAPFAHKEHALAPTRL